MAFLALFAAACADTIDTDEDPRIRVAAAAVAAEINNHYGYMERAEDMAEARLELQRHAAAMDAIQDELNASAPRLRCANGMTGFQSALKVRVATYLEDTARADTLGELRRLCRAYADDAQSLFMLTDDRCRAPG